jgi:dipeptidyl-peptidase 4
LAIKLFLANLRALSFPTMTKQYALSLLLGLWATTTALAQKTISVADIYSGEFAERGLDNLNWTNNGQFYTVQNGQQVVMYAVATGQPEAVLFDGAQSNPQVEFAEYNLSGDEQKILLATDYQQVYRRSFTANYYVYNLVTKQLTQLSGGGAQSFATFSPDGSRVAFVRANNLFYTELATGREIQVTTTGQFGRLIHGAADWVYEEEFSFARAFEWSPDGQRLAFISFDESEVKEYNLQVWQTGGDYPSDYRFKYPKAGQANSRVRVSVYELTGGQTRLMDLGPETDQYVPRIRWTRSAATLGILRLNRLQNQLELLHAEAATGQTQVVLTERSPTYIDEFVFDNLQYLQNGQQFLWASERDGYKHLYLYKTTGELVRQITQGPWEVTDFLGLDEKNQVLYYLSSEVSPLENQFYRVKLDGSGKTRLTQASGYHKVDLGRGYQYYIAAHSNAQDPLSHQLYRLADNQLVKVLSENEGLKARYRQHGLPQREFFTCQTQGGTVLNGYLLKPANFDPTKRYPVLLHVYGGPGSQQVRQQWSGDYEDLWHGLLTQRGYLVACIDNRGTGARGEVFKKSTYGQLGKLESMDQIAAARHLGSLPFVDKKRIGIWGWSYGGYLSSLCLFTGADVFKMGIAVAPVTNWRFYDTIYTERYLKRPQDNPNGYDDYAPLTHAAKLQGAFLLIHGTGDDNVHVQNAFALQNALVAAGRQFSSFYYPDRNHGIYGGNTRIHLYELLTDFVVKNL